jgi:hypothetical protein
VFYQEEIRVKPIQTNIDIRVHFVYYCLNYLIQAGTTKMREMSDVKLHGLLNMPIDLWDYDYIHQVQRHYAYVESSQKIYKLTDALEASELALRNAREELALLLKVSQT